MTSLLARAAVAVGAAVGLVAVAAPVLARDLPAEPTQLHLKDLPGLPLAWTDEGAVLNSEGDRWEFLPVEAMLDEGEHLIRHEPTGQCLTAAARRLGGGSVPLELVDCADADPWGAVFHDSADHKDYRFINSDGLLLGIDDLTEASAGTPVVAVDVPESKHDQEWRMGAVEQASEAVPAASEAPSEDAAPVLPTTGPGLAVAVTAGAAAVAGGIASVAWWRRRTLRAHW